MEALCQSAVRDGSYRRMFTDGNAIILKWVNNGLFG